MKKSKIIVDGSLLNRIASSDLMSEWEKVSFLHHITYMTWEEKMQLAQLI